MVTFLQQKGLITENPVFAGTWCGVVAGKEYDGQSARRFNPGSLRLRLHLLPSRALAKREASFSALGQLCGVATSATSKGTMVPQGRNGVNSLADLKLHALTYTLEPAGSHIKVAQNLAWGTTEITQLLDRPGARTTDITASREPLRVPTCTSALRVWWLDLCLCFSDSPFIQLDPRPPPPPRRLGVYSRTGVQA